MFVCNHFFPKFTAFMMSISIRVEFLYLYSFCIMCFFVACTRCHSRRYWVLCLQNYFLFALGDFFISFSCPPSFFSALLVFIGTGTVTCFVKPAKSPLNTWDRIHLGHKVVPWLHCDYFMLIK